MNYKSFGISQVAAGRWCGNLAGDVTITFYADTQTDLQGKIDAFHMGVSYRQAYNALTVAPEALETDAITWTEMERRGLMLDALARLITKIDGLRRPRS